MTGEIVNVPAPEISRARAINGSEGDRELLMIDILTFLASAQDTFLKVAPQRDPQWGYLVDSNAGGAVVSGVGPIEVSNSVGAKLGQFVNYISTGATLADNRVSLARPATHVVGRLNGSKMLIYSAWADGGVRFDGTGTGRIVWLGQDGNATLTAPVVGTVKHYRQSLGYRIGAGTSGVDRASVSIDLYPQVV